MSFFKTKKFYIILAVILLVGFLSYRQYQNKNRPPVYETVKVQRGTLVQTVEATGKVETAGDLSLRFEVPGTMGQVAVEEGASVKAGTFLVSLRLSELNAAVAQAQANLNQKIAGSSQAERNYYQAVVDQARADWDKAKSDTANAVAVAEAALKTAENNLKLAAGGENSQIVNNAYEDAVALLQTSLSVLDDGLTQADNILAMDNIFANTDFVSTLSILNVNKIPVAKSAYLTAKADRDNVRTAVAPLSVSSNHASVDNAVDLTISALSSMNQLLSKVADVLSATLPAGSLTQTALAAKQTAIDTSRSSVNTAYTNLISQRQALADAKNSYSTYSIAYDKAVKDLAAAKSSGDSSLKIKEAGFNQALANWENKNNPTREVDLAPLRAAFSQAAANRDKAVIRAPMNGVVAKINYKVGEAVSSVDPIIEMISPHFEIKVDIPETDVAKLKVNDQVAITLDALGDDVKLSGQVMSIDPASTVIQDVVYYKIKVTIDPTDQSVKAGMTANVMVNTSQRENALFIPLRVVRTNSERYVRVLAGKEVKEMPIKLGLKADDGRVEILEGLNEGDEVIVGIK